MAPPPLPSPGEVQGCPAAPPSHRALKDLQGDGLAAAGEAWWGAGDVCSRTFSRNTRSGDPDWS